MSLISYTLPCHKREADVHACLPMVLEAAALAPPVELVVVDYGCLSPLSLKYDLPDGVTLKIVRTVRQFFHMAHARNIGLRAATGDLVCLFLADQTVRPTFFSYVRQRLDGHPERLLVWQETFVGDRARLQQMGGFDERFELYGPEGKDLTDRWVRGGGELEGLPLRSLVGQRATPYRDKLKHYRVRLSRRDMHHVGMAIWRENQAAQRIIVNTGEEWGAA